MFNKTQFSLKKIISSLIVLSIFISCKNEVKPLEFKTTVFDYKFEADIEVEFDQAKENSEIAKTINKQIISEILKIIPTSKNQTTLKDALKTFDDEYKSFKTNFSDNNQAWYLAIETEILYKSEQVITIVLTVYTDTGGAHGNDNITFLNFNPENGKLFSNKELINNFDGFKTLAESYFLDHMKNEDSDIEELFFGKPFQLPKNIGFNDKGIILLYNVYEIASYNQGYTEFFIPKEKAKAFLNIEL